MEIERENNSKKRHRAPMLHVSFIDGNRALERNNESDDVRGIGGVLFVPHKTILNRLEAVVGLYIRFENIVS